MTTVFISGASVAGPTLAYWLAHRGLAVTVVERAPAVRPGGQAVDVRGVALDVLDRMGVLADARRSRTRMRGMSMLDSDGNEVGRSTEETVSGGRLDSDDVELLREDLTGLLYDSTRDGVEYVFGDSVVGLADTGEGVSVRFERGEPRTFDLVVGADGLHSTVRGLVFGPEAEFIHHLGTHLAIFGVTNFLGLDNWQIWLNDGEAGYGIYPVRDNTELRVTCGFGSAPPQSYHDVRQQKALVAQRLAGLGWETPRLLAAMWDAPDFYFDSMAQIRMDRWSVGRVTLVGDAAYSPSPMSGQGTSVALVGAYVLAEELAAAGGDHRAAFARYEARLRPFVELNQALATENPSGPPSEESVERAKFAVSLDASLSKTS